MANNKNRVGYKKVRSWLRGFFWSGCFIGGFGGYFIHQARPEGIIAQASASDLRYYIFIIVGALMVCYLAEWAVGSDKAKKISREIYEEQQIKTKRDVAVAKRFLLSDILERISLGPRLSKKDENLIDYLKILIETEDKHQQELPG